MTRRKDGLSVVAIRAWRYMRDEGGWFRPTEVAAALQLDVGAQRANAAVTKAMQALETRGHVARNPGQLDTHRPRFGVTTRCCAPDLETMTPSPAHKPAPMPEVA
jgi:hypothetical protein